MALQFQNFPVIQHYPLNKYTIKLQKTYEHKCSNNIAKKHPRPTSVAWNFFTWTGAIQAQQRHGSPLLECLSG